MKNKTKMLFALLFLFFTGTAVHSQSAQIGSWTFAGIVNGFNGSPLEDKYIVSEPNIERLDPTVGGELWFDLTPRAHPGCVQSFKVSWAFDNPVTTLIEGQTVNVQVSNLPVNDRGGIGLKECFALYQQRLYDDSQVTITFKGGGAESHPQQGRLQQILGTEIALPVFDQSASGRYCSAGRAEHFGLCGLCGRQHAGQGRHQTGRRDGRAVWEFLP